MIVFSGLKSALEISLDYFSTVKKYFISCLWTEQLEYMNWLGWMAPDTAYSWYGFKHVPNSYLGHLISSCNNGRQDNAPPIQSTFQFPKPVNMLPCVAKGTLQIWSSWGFWVGEMILGYLVVQTVVEVGVMQRGPWAEDCRQPRTWKNQGIDSLREPAGMQLCRPPDFGFVRYISDLQKYNKLW